MLRRDSPIFLARFLAAAFTLSRVAGRTCIVVMSLISVKYTPNYICMQLKTPHTGVGHRYAGCT
jgi:hypothetical protein